jgi:hypothetical protein
MSQSIGTLPGQHVFSMCEPNMVHLDFVVMEIQKLDLNLTVSRQ